MKDEKAFPVFSSRSLRVLGLKFKFSVHFGWIFVEDIRERPTIDFFSYGYAASPETRFEE